MQKITEKFEGYVDIGDIKMFYGSYGTGEPVFLLHGGIVSHTSWFFQIPPLSKHYQIIAPDTRAHGKSTDSDKPLSYELFASDVIKLMEKLDIKKASFIGASDGGCISLALGLKYPDVVNKLVLIGTSYNISNYHEGTLDNFKNYNPNEELPKEFALLKQMYEKEAPDPAYWSTLIKKLVQDLYLREPNFTLDQLKTINNPTLIIIGENDQFIPVACNQEMVDVMPNARLEVIQDATHLVPFEKPKQINKIILDFLGKE